MIPLLQRVLHNPIGVDEVTGKVWMSSWLAGQFAADSMHRVLDTIAEAMSQDATVLCMQHSMHMVLDTIAEEKAQDTTVLCVLHNPIRQDEVSGRFAQSHKWIKSLKELNIKITCRAICCRQHAQSVGHHC